MWVKDDCGSFEIGVGVDLRQELQSILRGGGGLKLGYRLMKEALQEHVRIMWVCEKASWDWYTCEVETTKTPAEALAYSVHMAIGAWAAEPHLWQTLQSTLFERQWLDFMEIPMGRSEKATRALHLSCSIVQRRGWTLSKHSCPPECHAPILKPGDEFAPLRQAAAATMRTQHQKFLSLEVARHTVADADDLWDNCLYLNMPPKRLVWEFFRRGKYSPASRSGRHLMFGLIATMPDNKSVEDVHSPLRVAARHNSNDKLSSANIQDVILHSKVFESWHPQCSGGEQGRPIPC